MNSTLLSVVGPDALKASAAPKNGPKVGDILCGTYGYEACIAVFAKVVGVTGSSVRVVELDDSRVYSNGGMDWVSTPIVNSDGPVVIKRVKPVGDSYRIKWNSCVNLYKWDGESVSCYNHH